MKKLRANFLSRRFASLLASTRGNVAITFALTTMPLVLAVGAAIDYTGANDAKSTLDAAADAAALGAVSKGAMSLNPDQAKANAEKSFKAQALNARTAKVTSATATITQTDNNRTAVFDYTANYQTSFMGIANYDTVNLRGSSTATSATLVYADFHLLLDNTPSMGIGATPNDVAILEKNLKCAFACHDKTLYPNDNYGKAKTLGAQTRFDTVRIATQSLMDTAQQTQAASGQIRMSVYSFGPDSANRRLTEVAPLSSDLDLVGTQAGKLQLMSSPDLKDGLNQMTDFDRVFSDINSKIAKPGDGSSPSSPLKYLFFVSDGLADTYFPSACDGIFTQDTGRCTEPIKLKNCDTIKARGIKIAVLYTTYQPVDSNSYRQMVRSLNKGPWGPSPNSLIAKNMQACASPGFFFEVSPTDGISEAMRALFLQIAKIAHITK